MDLSTLPTGIIADLWFDGLPPNPNRTRGQHWAKLYRTNQEWKQLAYILARNAYKGRPLNHAHLSYYISVGDNRVHDADNIEASLKSLQDGLKGVLLVDDSIDHITRSFIYNRRSPRGIRLIVAKTEPPAP